MKRLVLCVLLSGAAGPGPDDAPAAFDGASNGLVDQATHGADHGAFDATEGSRRRPRPALQRAVLPRVPPEPGLRRRQPGRRAPRGAPRPQGHFVNPSVPIADGAAVITGRTLINDRAICPSAAFPDLQIQERVPDTETIRTLRMSLSTFGDGFVEAVPDETLTTISAPASAARRMDGSAAAPSRCPSWRRRARPRRALRLEGPARQPALLRRRRLPERDGNHEPPAPDGDHDPLRHR